MKHIFIGIDGTANAAFYDTFYGNVYQMNLSTAFWNTKDNCPQIFIYFSGVGATAKKYFGTLGKAFGQGIDEIILQAYINLVSNYEEGDKIYVFGFSRGAVAARALTGMISRSGLVRYQHSSKIREAWHYFVNSEDVDKYGTYPQDKPTYVYPNVEIEFLGVWDTVYGISTDLALQRTLFTDLRFENLDMDRCVKHGVHILAIDDTRQLFHPMTWSKKAVQPIIPQTMEQIWMPGVHSDIGGGYEKSFLSSISMLTMIDKLAQYCPDVDFDRKYIADYIVPRLRDEQPVINNEWEFEGITQYVRPNSPRSCKNGDPTNAMQQSLHPLVAKATGKDFFVKTKKELYKPSFVLTDSNATLNPTEFDAVSYNATVVANVLQAKFP